MNSHRDPEVPTVCSPLVALSAHTAAAPRLLLDLLSEHPANVASALQPYTALSPRSGTGRERLGFLWLRLLHPVALAAWYEMYSTFRLLHCSLQVCTFTHLKY